MKAPTNQPFIGFSYCLPPYCVGLSGAWQKHNCNTTVMNTAENTRKFSRNLEVIIFYQCVCYQLHFLNRWRISDIPLSTQWCTQFIMRFFQFQPSSFLWKQTDNYAIGAPQRHKGSKSWRNVMIAGRTRGGKKRNSVVSCIWCSGINCIRPLIQTFETLIFKNILMRSLFFPHPCFLSSSSVAE